MAQIGAFGYVLHVSRLVTVAPPQVIEAHQGSRAAALFDRVADGSGLRALTELSAAGASTTAADALELLWDDLADPSE